MVRDFHINFDSVSVEEVLRNLESTFESASLADFLRNEATSHLRARARSRFSSEGDDATGKWLPLKESTNAIRRKLGFPPAHPINVRTGELKAYVLVAPPAIIQTAGAATLTWPGNVGGGRIEEKFLTAQIGSDVNHQYPGSYTPPRPVVGVSVNDMIQLQAETLEFIFFKAGRRGP